MGPLTGAPSLRRSTGAPIGRPHPSGRPRLRRAAPGPGRAGRSRYRRAPTKGQERCRTIGRHPVRTRVPTDAHRCPQMHRGRHPLLHAVMDADSEHVGAAVERRRRAQRDIARTTSCGHTSPGGSGLPPRAAWSTGSTSHKATGPQGVGWWIRPARPPVLPLISGAQPPGHRSSGKHRRAVTPRARRVLQLIRGLLSPRIDYLCRSTTCVIDSHDVGEVVLRAYHDHVPGHDVGHGRLRESLGLPALRNDPPPHEIRLADDPNDVSLPVHDRGGGEPCDTSSAAARCAGTSGAPR